MEGLAVGSSLASSANPVITVSRLLKSCAMPPARRPTASSFCDWCSWPSSLARSCSIRCRSASSERSSALASPRAMRALADQPLETDVAPDERGRRQQQRHRPERPDQEEARFAVPGQEHDEFARRRRRIDVPVAIGRAYVDPVEAWLATAPAAPPRAPREPTTARRRAARRTGGARGGNSSTGRAPRRRCARRRSAGPPSDCRAGPATSAADRDRHRRDSRARPDVVLTQIAPVRSSRRSLTEPSASPSAAPTVVQPPSR